MCSHANLFLLSAGLGCVGHVCITVSDVGHVCITISDMSPSTDSDTETAGANKRPGGDGGREAGRGRGKELHEDDDNGEPGGGGERVTNEMMMMLRSIRDSISLLMPAHAPRPSASAFSAVTGRNAAGSGINVHQMHATFEGGAATPALAANEQALEVCGVAVGCGWGWGWGWG